MKAEFPISLMLWKGIGLPKLVIIRGNSGSGKTAVAKVLQHKLGHNIMVVSQDVVRRGYITGKRWGR